MEEGWLPSPYLTTKPLFSELSHWSRAWIQVKGSKKRCRKQKKNLKFLIAQKHEAIIIQRHLLIWEIVCCPHSFWLLSSFLLFVVLPPFVCKVFFSISKMQFQIQPLLRLPLAQNQLWNYKPAGHKFLFPGPNLCFQAQIFVVRHKASCETINWTQICVTSYWGKVDSTLNPIDMKC